MIRRRAGETETIEKSLWKRYFPDRLKTQPVKPDGRLSYSYLPEPETEKADILYFAGCMTHLTPSIKNSMVKILDASGVNYKFMDEEGGACCGRPLMLAGQDREARELINHNSQIIWKSGAQILVTSCPICYKVFKESYYLDVEVMHHTQFIKMLIEDGSLKLNFLRKKVTYHTPCDLGRGSGVYDEPKDVLKYVARLQKTDFEDENSLCCGGSLGNMKMSSHKKSLIARDTAALLTQNNPDILATSCPLCKKTLASVTETKVADISEIVAEALILPQLKKNKPDTLLRLKEPASTSQG
jgi:Fe-S oxidoreductase